MNRNSNPLLSRTAAALIAAVAATACVAPAMAQQQPTKEDGPTPMQMQPRMMVGVEVLDFGTVPDNELLSKEFKIRNEGRANLEIKSLQASCGCTRPETDREILRPGEEATITVGFKPFNRVGIQNQRVTISTNDPERPTTVVRVKADVQPRLFLEPKVLQFPGMRKGDPMKRTIKVAGRESDFEVTNVVFDGPGEYTWELGQKQEVLKAGTTLYEYEVDITAQGDVPVGNSILNLTIQTNDPVQPSKPMRASLTMLGELVVTPARVGLRALRPGTQFSSQVRVTHRGRAPFEISEAVIEDISGSQVEAEVVKLDDFSYRINVLGTATDSGRFVRGKIILKTTVEGEDDIEVPYFGTLLGQRPAR